MEPSAKIILSDTELKFVQDKQFIIVKQHIITVVFDMFSILSKKVQEAILSEKLQVPAELFHSVPKISRGENYRSFPYVMLDYPSIFKKEGVIALRTMFWWGHFFSVTLHVSGVFKTALAQKISTSIKRSSAELFICKNEEEWEHHFEPGNYSLIVSLPDNDLTKLIAEQPFIKIAVKYPISEWGNMIDNLEKGSLDLLTLLEA
ncbi:MAG: hypothetical protein ABIY51_03950 [Ferruginibacter sp.]